jgi:hypothetical protein
MRSHRTRCAICYFRRFIYLCSARGCNQQNNAKRASWEQATCFQLHMEIFAICVCGREKLSIVRGHREIHRAHSYCNCTFWCIQSGRRLLWSRAHRAPAELICNYAMSMHSSIEFSRWKKIWEMQLINEQTTELLIECVVYMGLHSKTWKTLCNIIHVSVLYVLLSDFFLAFLLNNVYETQKKRYLKSNF